MKYEDIRPGMYILYTISYSGWVRADVLSVTAETLSVENEDITPKIMNIPRDRLLRDVVLYTADLSSNDKIKQEMKAYAESINITFDELVDRIDASVPSLLRHQSFTKLGQACYHYPIYKEALSNNTNTARIGGILDVNELTEHMPILYSTSKGIWCYGKVDTVIDGIILMDNGMSVEPGSLCMPLIKGDVPEIIDKNTIYSSMCKYGRARGLPYGAIIDIVVKSIPSLYDWKDADDTSRAEYYWPVFIQALDVDMQIACAGGIQDVNELTAYMPVLYSLRVGEWRHGIVEDVNSGDIYLISGQCITLNQLCLPLIKGDAPLIEKDNIYKSMCEYGRERGLSYAEVVERVVKSMPRRYAYQLGAGSSAAEYYWPVFIQPQ